MEEKSKLKSEFKNRLYNYILQLIKFLNALPKNQVINTIINQLMRSGTSVGANYFEAEAASSKRDYQNFFNHSLKSANESLFWLTILKNSDLVPDVLKKNYDWLLNETQQLANIFASSIITMKNKR